MSTPKFEKALKALELLLEGKSAKEAMHEAGLHHTAITDVKKRFPLFLGLPNLYTKKDDPNA